MMIEIQKEITITPKINRDMLIFAISETLSELDNKDSDITLRLTDDEEMRQLNTSYRNINQTTDVLSFDQDLIDPETGHLYLGDVIISLDRAVQQAPENGHSLDEECAFLAIHGTLHLLGKDHAQEEERQQMWALQDRIFKQVLDEFRSR